MLMFHKLSISVMSPWIVGGRKRNEGLVSTERTHASLCQPPMKGFTGEVEEKLLKAPLEPPAG